jgi:hypothetical protein
MVEQVRAKQAEWTFETIDAAIAEYVEKGIGDPAALREWCDQWEGMEAEVALIDGAEAKWNAVKPEEPRGRVEPGAGWDNGRIRLWARDRGVDPAPWLERAEEARRKQAEPEPAVSEGEEAPKAEGDFFGPETQPDVEEPEEEPEAERDRALCAGSGEDLGS